MPLPNDVTRADFDRWDAKLAETAANEPDAAFVLTGGDSLKSRAWYTGSWLGEKLENHGCPSELASSICFAFGQRALLCPDPWATAQWALDEYIAGRHEEPGEELAERIMLEYPAAFFQMFGAGTKNR